MTDHTLYVTESESATIAALEPGEPVQIRRPVEGVPEGITEVHRWGDLDPLARDPDVWGFWGCEGFDIHQPHNCYDFETRCPYGQSGDQLIVVYHLTIESVRVEDRIDGDSKHWHYWVIDAADHCHLTVEGVRVEWRGDADGEYYYWVIDARRE